MRAIGTQLRCETAELDGALVRLQEVRVHVPRRAHAEGREREIRLREADVGAAVGRRVDDRLLEAFDRAVEAFACSAVPEMPSAAHELVRARHFNPVSELRLVDDPGAELAEALA